ncbi:MAG: hypothetical protein K9H12_07255 [Bacteroidales bacterium]|nr:hypothetical protein [Bacteroidales bacterium]
MKKFPVIIMFLLSFILSSSFPERIDYNLGRYNNVCKDLKDDALLYFVFIDSKETSPWTEFDIKSTIDSLSVAVKWIQKEAEKNNITLKIKTDYYIGNEYTTINRSLPKGSVNMSISEPNLEKGTLSLNKWSDYVAKVAGSSFYITDKDGIPVLQNPRDAERLIALLRDEYSVESVALLFMVNNYYRTDISIALNTMTQDHVEYAIVSYKYPSEIAHNFLHLYGAADLYKTPFRKSESKIKKAGQWFPNEIMQDPYAKNIMDLEISDYTKYLIGWQEELDESYKILLTDKFINY